MGFNAKDPVVLDWVAHADLVLITAKVLISRPVRNVHLGFKDIQNRSDYFREYGGSSPLIGQDLSR